MCTSRRTRKRRITSRLVSTFWTRRYSSFKSLDCCEIRPDFLSSFCLQMLSFTSIFPLFHTCHCPLVFGGIPLCFVQDKDVLTFFEIRTGGTGKNPTEVGRIEGGRRCGDYVMIDFYRTDSLIKNGVMISGDRVRNSTSYPVLMTEEEVMRLLD